MVSDRRNSNSNPTRRARLRARCFDSLRRRAYRFSRSIQPGKISMYAGETPGNCAVGGAISENGKLTFCGKRLAPQATTVYGEALKSAGNFTLTPRPKKRPSPTRHSWSGAREVWFEPTLA